MKHDTDSSKQELYLGLDLSLRGTGMCLLSPNNVEETTTSIVRVSPSVSSVVALQTIVNTLRTAITGKGITLCAIEGYSFGSKIGQFQMGEVGGVVRLLLHELEVPFVIVPPTMLKKWTTGNGTADKIQMGVATFAEWGLQFPDDNQCDAFNLATVAAACDGSPLNRMNAARKQIVAQIQADPLSTGKRKTK